jgi:xanthine dehydrogenase large subunit
MAVASIADYQVSPQLDAPATPERVLMAVERLKALVADAEMSGEDGADA